MTKTELMQLSQVELAEMALAKQQEVDAMAAALSLAKQMMHDYEMMVDCPAPTEHRHKMDKMYAALAEHDAEVARKAIKAAAENIEYACCQYSFAVDIVDQGKLDVVPLNQLLDYANQLKRGEVWCE